MAEGHEAGNARGSSPAQNPMDFILDRTRSEVHLLLDNISANPDITITDLMARTPPPEDLKGDWIRKVCEITWPPKSPDDDLDEMAKQAALLIKARDYLNGLAKPASGASIAFTLLVTQGEGARGFRRRKDVSGTPTSPSRSSLAFEAYPDLVARARSFRSLMTLATWTALSVLVITLAASWYLAIGNAALTDYRTAQSDLLAAETQVSQAQSALFTSQGQDEQSQSVANSHPSPRTSSNSATTGGSDTTATAYYVEPCKRRLVDGSYSSDQMRQACAALARQRGISNAVSAGLSSWSVGASPAGAAWFANLLGSAALPVLYGFLGAIASVVRTWSRKIKDSLLSPRDKPLSLQQLALGLLTGACISLFIAAPGSGSNEAALLGPVALSSSAIAFVAGFGVESVFQALEALISRIFNIAPAGASVRHADRRPS